MTNGCLCGIVWRLRLRDIDHSAGHRANHDHASFCLSVHQMTGDAGCEEIGAVDVDAPKFLHTIVGIGDRVEVLGEPGRGDQVINLAVVCDNLFKRGVDRVWIRDIGVVSGDFGDSRRT